MDKVSKSPTIALKIPGIRIPAEKLRKSIGAFYNFIDEIASEVSGQRRPIRWIVRVTKGSVVLTNEAEVIGKLAPNTTRIIIDSIESGVVSLEKEAIRPHHFSDRALEFLQDLASASKEKENGHKPITIKVKRKAHKLTVRTVANIDSILGVYSKSLGSIEGKLSTLSERGGLKFFVYDSLTDKPIRCDIDEDWRAEAMKGFGKRIYVFGLISYDKYGTAKSIRVQELRIFREKETLPSAAEICGILEA